MGCPIPTKIKINEIVLDIDITITYITVYERAIIFLPLNRNQASPKKACKYAT